VTLKINNQQRESHVCGDRLCVFRLLSTKPSTKYQLQPPGGTTVTAPSGLRSRVCGQSLIPSTESGSQPPLDTYNLSSLALTPGEPTPYVCMYVSMVHTHMWYVRGYVLGEGGVNASTSIERNSKLEGYNVVFAVMIVLSHKGQVM